MRSLLHAGKLLLLDMASTIVFLVVFLLTHEVTLSFGIGMALGIAQMGWQFSRKKPIDTMEWLSLVLVVGSGAATLVTNDARFVMFKPSLIYVIVGLVMLKPGWINRYLPPLAKAVVPDIAVILGFVWAGLMFASAAVNAFVALNFSVVTWAAFMPGFGVVSKVVLFLAGFAMMRCFGRRRLRSMPTSERDALVASVDQSANARAAGEFDGSSARLRASMACYPSPGHAITADRTFLLL
jgi:intracellular septation protein